MGVVAEGGYGTGVNPNGVYFPFIQEVTGAKRLFADLYLGHRVTTAVLPLRVTYIKNFTQPVTAGRAEMTIVDANGSTVFNSTSAAEYRNKDWSGRFRIHEWISDDAVLRVVQHTGQNDLEDVLAYPSEQTLSNAVLDERTAELWPDNVLSFVVNGYPIKGEVEFVGGYNFETKLNSIARSSGKAHVNKIYVAAEPGSGLGREEGCVGTTEYPIRAINGVKPKDGGSFILTPTDCLWFANPGTVSPQGQKNHIAYQFTNGLLLKNNCLPCCSCDDFVNTYQGIRKLYNSYSTLGTRATSVRNQHADNVDRWLSQKDCRETDPVKINIMPFKVSDASGFKIGVGICNIDPGCRGELSLDLNFEAPNGLRGYINKDTLFAYSGSGYSPEEYQVLGDWPNYQVKWLNARGQSLSKLKLDIAFARTPSVSSVTWEGTTELLDESGETVLSLSTMTIPSGPSRIIVNRFSALNSDKTKEYGYRVNDTVHVESYNVLVNLEQGIFKPTSLVAGQNARIAFKLLNSITSTSMKPFALQPHITSVENDPSKLRRLLLTVPSGIQGNPYVKFDGKLRMRDGMLIMPAYSPGIRSNDYVKLTATAKLNGETIPNGVKTVTRSLKV
jgi:hypothetical protein